MGLEVSTLRFRVLQVLKLYCGFEGSFFRVVKSSRLLGFEDVELEK